MTIKQSEDSKSLSTQAYDHLSWVGQQLGTGVGLTISAISKVASATKYFLEFGVHDIDKETLKRWENSQNNRLLEPCLAPMPAGMGKPYPGFVSQGTSYTNIARRQGILPPLTPAQKLQESQRGNYQTCTEACLRQLYMIDPNTNELVIRA